MTRVQFPVAEFYHFSSRAWPEKRKTRSDAGTRTRVAWVKARYPNQLDYIGLQKGYWFLDYVPNALSTARDVILPQKGTPGFEPGTC